jgi:hypothetical protein
MSALGQKQTCAVQKGMSAIPPMATAKADIFADRGAVLKNELRPVARASRPICTLNGFFGTSGREQTNSLVIIRFNPERTCCNVAESRARPS